MGGLVIAGIALVLLVLFLKLSKPLSEEEKAEIKRMKKEEKELARYKKDGGEGGLHFEEDEQKKRTLRTDKATELLVQVMEDGSVAEIEQAISNGIDILQKLENDQTLLMIAVKNNPSPDVVQFLLDKGIEINDVDGNGQSALILAAAFNSNPEIVTTLLNNGADKTIRDKSNKTAADYVVLNSSFFGTEIPALLKV